jgi:thioesterase domain-containing protein
MDNYFHLGGDSLKAEEIVTRISSLLDVENLPIVIFLQAPTIKQMSSLLESEELIDDPTLICLQRGGSKLPLYLIHACGGEVLFFSDLVKHLEEGRPIYAFRAPTKKGAAFEHNTIEELAEFYLKTLIDFQKEGAYYLGGAALGGLIALEMANTLYSFGFLKSVILFDSVPPIPQVHKEGVRGYFLNYLGRIKYHWRTGEFYGRVKDYLVRKYDNLSSRRNSADDPQFELKLHLQRLSQKYEPKMFDGDVVLFVSEYRRGFPKDPYFRVKIWDDLLKGNIHSHIISGEHTDILKEPHVENLASILKEHLIE